MKKNIFKIKDLPKDFNLVGCKLDGVTIISGWNKGFWMEVNGNGGNGNVTPLFFQDYDEIKDWKVEVPAERVLQLRIKK